MYAQLIISVLILLAYCVVCTAWCLRVRHLDRRRAAREQIRRVRRYTVPAPASGPAKFDNVIDLPGYSVKVPADDRWAWRVDGGAA